MTKQNHIHKLLVIREKGRKDILKFLSGIPKAYNDKKNVRKRKRTYSKALLKELKAMRGKLKL